MVVRFQCPNPSCAKRYEVDELLIGSSTTCRYCGQPITIAGLDRETGHPGAAQETPQSRQAAPSPTEDVPEKLGRFEIGSRLGSGAFGTVYRAHDPVLDREVALKVPRAAVLQKPEARARFLREPKAAAQLRHPSIVPVYDAGTEGERYYIASAYIDGRTLEEVIAEGRLDFRRAAKMIRDLAGALDYAHRKGVIHRDVKPANIMIDRQDQTLLMDFGLARLDTSQEKLTQDGTVMGTPAYMAPEQADGTMGEVGPSSDQYSLGVVLYELLTGETPFSGPPTVLLFNAINRDPETPRRKDASIARDLETICLKAMSKKPQERYPDCGTMAEDLRCWLADEPIMARRLGPIERTGRWMRRNPVVASLAGAVMVVAVVGLLAVTWQWRQAESSRGLAEERLQTLRAEERQKSDALAKLKIQTAAALENEAEAQRQQGLAEAARLKAQAAAAEAQRQQGLAESASADARRQQGLADAARKEAERALANELPLRREAELQRQRAEKSLYPVKIALAQAKWQAGDVYQVRSVLNGMPSEFRDFEWGYLNRLCHLEKETLQCAPAHIGRDLRLLAVSAAFSPDLKYIAIGPNPSNSMSEGTAALICDTTTGELRIRLSSDGARGARSLAFSADGSRLLESNHRAVWETGTWTKVATLPSRADKQPAISEDGQLVAHFNHRGMSIKKLPSVDALRIPERLSTTPARAVTFSPVGNLLAVVDLEGRITVWDVNSGRFPAIVFDAPTSAFAIRELLFSPDAKRLAVVSKWTVTVFDVQTGTQLARFDEHEAEMTCLAFDATGRRIASGSDAGVVRVWIAASGDELKVCRSTYGGVIATAFHPTGDLLSAHKWGTLNRWSLDAADSGQVYAEHTGAVRDVTFSDDDRRVASISSDIGDIKKELRIWETSSGKTRLVYGGAEFESFGPLRAVAFIDGGRSVITASCDNPFSVNSPTDNNKLAVWSADPASRGCEVLPGSSRVEWLVTDSTGERLLACGEDWKNGKYAGETRILDAATRRPLLTLHQHEGNCDGAALARDGTIAVVAGTDREGRSHKGRWLRVWDTTSGKESVLLDGPEASDLLFGPIALSPDARSIASVRQSQIHLLDSSTGQKRFTLTGHTGWTQRVTCLAFSPLGRRLASGGQDRMVRVWDTATGTELLVLEGHTDSITDVDWSHDGRKIASSSMDGTVRIWEAWGWDEPEQEDGETTPRPDSESSAESSTESGPAASPSRERPAR